MNARAKAESRLSYAGADAALRRDMPVSLRELRAAKLSFDHARDPYFSAQLKALKQTETQRREEQGRGSMMVKLHKPFPELKPKAEQGPVKHSFNQAWLKEYRAAKLATFKETRGRDCQTQERDMTRIMKGRER